MKRTMKFLLATMFAAMIVSSAAAQTVWFDTAGPGQNPVLVPTNGNNNVTVNGSVGNPSTLYIWASAGATPLSPQTVSGASAGQIPTDFPGNTQPSAAYFAYD